MSERLTLLLIDRLAAPARSWAAEVLNRPEPVDRSAVAATLCRRSAQISRVDGAVAGTPFLVALVPGYVGHLWQEGVLVLRLAALYGRDPRDERVAAEFLYLRQIHPSVELAERALERVRAEPMPPPPGRRRRVGDWIQWVWTLGVFGGFLSPRAQPPAAAAADGAGAAFRRWVNRIRRLGRFGLVAAGWIVTWIFPITFMLAMSWGCESHCRRLGRDAAVFYSGDPASGPRLVPPFRGWRRLIRSTALVLSVAIPILFVAFAVRVRNRTGFGGVEAAAGIVALSLVVAMGVVARRL